MPKKRILLLSEGFGKGHTQAAHALSLELRQSSSEVITKVIELGAFLHPTLAPLVFKAYRRTVISQPKLYGMLYRQQYGKSLNRTLSLALHKLFYSQTKAVIDKLRPDIIVCTHPFPGIIVSRLKRSGLTTPLFTVITDYDAHGTWTNPEVNKYLVSTENVRNKLMEHGVPESSIEITGIPIHPSFRTQYDKEQIRREFGLKEMPTVMMMGGGWGIFNKDEQVKLLNDIAAWRDSIQLVVCFGTNDHAREQMLEDETFRHPHIHLLGYTTQINKLMDVSDLLITKPGGITCTEGLAKGIPMLFYSAIPGQEEENCQYFEEMGYGQQIKSFDIVERWFRMLLDQYPVLEKRRSHMRSHYQIQTLRCSEAIMNYLQIERSSLKNAAYIEASMSKPIAHW